MKKKKIAAASAGGRRCSLARRLRQSGRAGRLPLRSGFDGRGGDVHVLAEPGAERAVPEGLELPADLRLPRASPPASPRLLQDAAARPQVLRQEAAGQEGFAG